MGRHEWEQVWDLKGFMQFQTGEREGLDSAQLKVTV